MTKQLDGIKKPNKPKKIKVVEQKSIEEEIVHKIQTPKTEPKPNTTPKITPKTPAKSPKSPLSVITQAFFCIYFIVAAGICGLLTYLSVFPLRYLLIISGISAALALIFALFAFKKSFKKVAKSIILAFEIIFTALFLVAFFYLNQTMNFLDAIRAGNYQIEEYYVVVRADTPYNNIQNLENHNLAIYNDTSENYASALEKVQQETNLATITYPDYIDATTAMLESQALIDIADASIKITNTSGTIAEAIANIENLADDTIINGHIDALLLQGSLYQVAEEIIPNFSAESTKIIYTVEIKVPLKSEEVNIDISTEPFNIYISGIDTYGEISRVSRSDVNMIMTVNPKTHQILLTSIPRDYYVQLHGTYGPRDKLTHAGIYGVDMSRQTLEDLFGINIDYYIRINFSSAIDLINAVDGVEVTPDTTFTARANSGCHFYEGQTVHVNGDCALAYARERYAYASGDRHRVQNQQEVLAAIIAKITSSRTLIAKYTDILASIGTSLQTNIPSSQIYKLVNLQLDTMPSWTIDRISVDGYGSMDITYSTGSQVLYVMIPDENTVYDAIVKINEVLGTPIETETEEAEATEPADFTE